MCTNIRIKFLSWACMYSTLQVFGKRVIQANPSEFDERLFSDIIILVQITFERETDRQRLRQRDRKTETERDRNRQADRQRRRRRKDVVNQCPSLI